MTEKTKVAKRGRPKGFKVERLGSSAFTANMISNPKMLLHACVKLGIMDETQAQVLHHISLPKHARGHMSFTEAAKTFYPKANPISIRQGFSTVGLNSFKALLHADALSDAVEKPEKTEKPKRARSANRPKEEVAKDLEERATRVKARLHLHLPSRGRLSEEQSLKLESYLKEKAEAKSIKMTEKVETPKPEQMATV